MLVAVLLTVILLVMCASISTLGKAPAGWRYVLSDCQRHRMKLFESFGMAACRDPGLQLWRGRERILVGENQWLTTHASCFR
jgi:hypothetical protein